jgi:hypothetical protein
VPLGRSSTLENPLPPEEPLHGLVGAVEDRAVVHDLVVHPHPVQAE